MIENLGNILSFVGFFAVLLCPFWLATRLAKRLERKGYKGPFAEMVPPLFVAGGGIAALLYTDGHAEPIPATLVLAAALVWLLPTRQARVGGSRAVRFPYRAMARILFAALAIWLPYRLISGEWLSNVTWSVSSLLVTAGYLCLNYVHRAAAPTAAAAVAADPRPPALYLRACEREDEVFAEFPRRLRDLAADWASGHYGEPSQRYQTLEEYLDEEIGRSIGPLVALGNPLDYLPPESGAARLYVGDEGWQNQFATLAERAACILMAAGVSDNMLWEYRYLREAGHQQRLFVLTPPDLLRAAARGPWRRAIACLERSLTCGSMKRLRGVRPFQWGVLIQALEPLGYLLPVTDPGRGAVIAFDNEGRGFVLTTDARHPADYVRAIQQRERFTTGGRAPAKAASAPQ